MQRRDAPENPYLGSPMPSCGTETTWQPSTAAPSSSASSLEEMQQGVVMIDEARRQLIGVRTEPVVRGPMRQNFRAVGHITYDESAMADVTLKVHGWITKLYVSQTGQSVARGQPLFTMYSPELYNAEQDFLLGVA